MCKLCKYIKSLYEIATNIAYCTKEVLQKEDLRYIIDIISKFVEEEQKRAKVKNKSEDCKTGVYRQNKYHNLLGGRANV